MGTVLHSYNAVLINSKSLFIHFESMPVFQNINDDGTFISISVCVEVFILLIQELVLLKFTLKSQCI